MATTLARRFFLEALCVTLVFASGAGAQVGSVIGRIGLDDSQDPFERTLGEKDEFGSALASLGDLNGDGLNEFAIGAPGDFHGRGALWIFSLTGDRKVRKYVKLGPFENLPFALKQTDHFGASVTALGDLDGDGVGEIAVGAPGDGSGHEGGTVWVLFLRASGFIKSFLQLGHATSLLASLRTGDGFGSSVAAIGDLDGNGVQDLAVGAPGDDIADTDEGALWILFFRPDRTLLSIRKLSGVTGGGFTGSLARNDRLGSALALLGDLGSDGTPELAAGATGRDTIWVVSLASDGQVSAKTSFALAGAGSALARLDDLDGDGIADLAAGAPEAAFSACAVVQLLPSGLPKATVTFSGPTGGFGSAVAAAGDTNGDGHPDLVVGLPHVGTRVLDSGAFAFLDLDPSGAVVGSPQLIDAVSSGLMIAPKFVDPLDNDAYGDAIAALGDLNGDGFPEVAVGMPGDEDGGTNAGAVWIHFLSATGGTRVAKLSRTQAALPIVDGFGATLAGLGDLDGDGIADLAVGASTGIYLLFMRSNGDIVSFREIPFGHAEALASLGDLDGDGLPELAATSAGEVFVHFLAADGTVKTKKRLQSGATTLFGNKLAYMGRSSGDPRRFLAVSDGSALWRLELDPAANVVSARSRPGTNTLSIASIGDLDGDGIGDIAVLIRQSFHQGLLELQFLRDDWSVRSTGTDHVGSAFLLATVGDLSGDGVPDLAGGVSPTFGLRSGRRVALYELAGFATRDFELQDDARQEPLENGRSIPSPYVGRTLTLSSSGPNRGAAIFDSNPAGPNHGDDLCIGSGNVLILQDDSAPAQSSAGIFAHPHDDPDGGVLTFSFPRPSEPRALTLADLDPAPNRGAVLTLFDDRNHTRTYIVPPGWTGGFGVPGARRLELNTLAPQAGAGSASATASQTLLFSPATVVRLEVELFDGGALDNLIYSPH